MLRIVCTHAYALGSRIQKRIVSELRHWLHEHRQHAGHQAPPPQLYPHTYTSSNRWACSSNCRSRCTWWSSCGPARSIAVFCSKRKSNHSVCPCISVPARYLCGRWACWTCILRRSLSWLSYQLWGISAPLSSCTACRASSLYLTCPFTVLPTFASPVLPVRRLDWAMCCQSAAPIQQTPF